MKATVIGGAGVIGFFFAEILSGRYQVIIADPDEKRGEKAAQQLNIKYIKDNKSAVEDADIVLVSTPIKKTPDVLRQIIPEMKSGSLLMDATSVKSRVLEAYREAGREDIEFISIHPMFCPPTKLEGQTIIVIPISGVSRLTELTDLFRSLGLKVAESTIEEHDEIMALVQVLIHVSFMGINSTIKEMGYTDEKLRPYMGKFHQVLFDFIPRITSQNPQMYASIQTENESSQRVCEILLEKIDLFKKLIIQNETSRLANELKLMSDIYINSELSIKRTNRLIDSYEEDI